MVSSQFGWWCGKVTVLAIAMWVGAAGSALAGPITDPRPVIETVVGANLGCNPAGPFGGPGLCLNDEDPVNFQTFGPDPSYPPGAGAGLVGFSGTFPLVNGDSMTGSATADAAFGRLKVKASAAYDLSTPETAFTFANAHVIDLLTIDALGLTGTPGTLDVTYFLDGTVSSSGAALAGVNVGVMWGGPEPFNQDDSAFSFHGSSTSAPVTVSVPFMYGDPFFLAMIISAFAGTAGDCPTCPGGVGIVERTGPGAGSADFFSTMALIGLLPKDAAGVPVADPTFSSASGTRYSVSGVVPEPGSLLLLGFGVAAAARRWRGQRT